MFKFGTCASQEGNAFSFGGPFSKGMNQTGQGPWALLKEVNLTDEQIEKLAELKLEGLGKFAQCKSSMIGLFQQLGKELSKEQIDKAKVKDIAKQIQSRKAELSDSFIDRILSFTDLLSTEQRQRLRLNGIKQFLGLGSMPSPEEA